MNLRIITRPARLGTSEFAEALQAAGHSVQPQSIRRALVKKGHYLNERPLKMPSGRLLWDAAAVQRLTTPTERGLCSPGSDTPRRQPSNGQGAEQ